MAAQRNGDRIVKAYLSIQNPMFVKVPPNKMADPAYENKIIAEAKAKGHDGVRFETDTDNEIARDVFWVAFDPAHQLKSATDNIGTFDVNNPDIRFSLESSGSEEFKLQVKAMQSLVGNFLDQNGAGYVRMPPNWKPSGAPDGAMEGRNQQPSAHVNLEDGGGPAQAGKGHDGTNSEIFVAVLEESHFVSFGGLIAVDDDDAV